MERKPDPATMTDDYTEGAVRDRRADAGRSYGRELLIATGVAVVFLAWAFWAFVLV